ncbi:MAG: Ig-like domain-containing protein [Oscillospiraceae bacterium]|nr:Ig-like domain-containing protein [Oscillospiraceae bacterium]
MGFKLRFKRLLAAFIALVVAVTALPAVQLFAAADVPAGIQSDVPVGIQADVPAGIQADVPADVPADIQADVSADIQVDVPVQVQQVQTVEGEFSVLSGMSTDASITPGSNSWTLENETMRATVGFDNGGIDITGIYNKKAAREMLGDGTNRSLFDFTVRNETPSGEDERLIKPIPGDPAGMFYVDNGDPRVLYSANWETGGGMKNQAVGGGIGFYMNGQAYANATDAWMELTFTGNYVEIYAAKAPGNTSNAAVYIDDMTTPVDGAVNFTADTEYVDLIWDSSNVALDGGEHTIRVVKGNAGGHLRLDCFRYGYGNDSVTKVGIDDPRLNYNDDTKWTKQGSAVGPMYFIGARHAYTTTIGEYVELTFTGSAIQWMISKDGSRGVAEISIDGQFVADVDCAQRSGFYEGPEVAFEKTDLSYGEHTIRVALKSGGNILFNSFIYSGNPDTYRPFGEHFADNGDIDTVSTGDPLMGMVKYSNWGASNSPLNQAAGTGFYMGGHGFTNVSGATIELTFDGTFVELYCDKASNRVTTATAYIDGTLQSKPVNLTGGGAGLDPRYSGTGHGLAWSLEGLTPGPHTLKIVSNQSAYLMCDYFRYGYDQDEETMHRIDGVGDSNLTITGNWESAATGGHRSNSAGDAIEFVFEGTAIQWYGTKLASANGQAEVYIDGVLRKTINMRSSFDGAQSAIDASGVLYDNFLDGLDLSVGTHSIKIVNLSGSVVHSAFAYGPPPPPALYDVTDISAKDGKWTLGTVKIDTIEEYKENAKYRSSWGKSLEIPLTHADVDLQLTLVFEIYDGEAGLRYYTKVKNLSGDDELTITKSDVLKLDFSTGPRSLYYVPMQVQWTRSPDGALANGRRNALVVYDDGYGWSLNPENNWATSLAPGAYTGNVNETFLKLDVFKDVSGAANSYARVYTNPNAVQLTLFENEEMEYFANNITVFQGDDIDGRMAVAEHFRKRFKFTDPSHRISTNDWIWGGGQNITSWKSIPGYRDVQPGQTKSLVDKIVEAGIDAIHIDDFWNCWSDGGYARPSKNETDPISQFVDPTVTGANRNVIWDGQNGTPNGTQMLSEFADYLFDRGLKFGLWFSPSGGATGWGDGYNLGDPDSIAIKQAAIQKQIDFYRTQWIQIDQGIFWKSRPGNDFDHEMDSVYRKVLNVRDLMNYFTHKDPELFMQTTCEVDNPSGQQGFSLIHVADNGLGGLYQRTESGNNVKDAFGAFGVLPLETLVTTYGEGGQPSWFADSEWYYQLIIAKHSSIYSHPRDWDDEGIALMGTFNSWRKSSRIKALVDEITRPVYFDEGIGGNVSSGAANGPYAWLYTDEGRTHALMLAIGGPNTTVNSFTAKPRWLDPNKTYLITDVSLLDRGEDKGSFQNQYIAKMTGSELQNSGMTVDLTSNGTRGKAYWFSEDNGLPIQVLYADHTIEDYRWSYNPATGALTVTMTGNPGDSGEIAVYKESQDDAEVRLITFGASGRQTAVFDATTTGGGKEIIEKDRDMPWIDDIDAEYSNGWTAATGVAGYFDGTQHYSNVPGASFSVKFKGENVKWFGGAGPDGGMAEVWIDGVKVGTADTYSAAAERVLLFELNGLASGMDHTFRVVVSPDGNILSSGNVIRSDFVDFTASAGETIDDSNLSRIVYNNLWGGNIGSSAGSGYGYYNNTHSYTNVANAAADFVFTGDSVEVQLTRDGNRGNALIYLDGVLQATIDTTGPGTGSGNKALYDISNLDLAPHRLTVVCQGPGYISLDRITYTYNSIVIPVIEEIVGVGSFTGFEIPVGTAWDALLKLLPKQAVVSTNIGNTRFAQIVWDDGDYDGDVEGVYTLHGVLTLNSTLANALNIEAEIIVTVGASAIPPKSIEDIPAMSNIYVQYGTALNDIPLPDKITVTLDDGSTADLQLNWGIDSTPPYDGNIEGDYEFFAGAILPSDDSIVNGNHLNLGVITIVTVLEEEVPITSLRIAIGTDAVSSTVSVVRNSTLQFDVLLNDGASGNNLVWSVSDTSIATVDSSGNVTIKNKVGMAVLTVTDPVSGISFSTILRIT